MPADLQAIIETGDPRGHDPLADDQEPDERRGPGRDAREAWRDGRTRRRDDILKKTLEAWDEIAKEESAKNPFFKKIYDSQRAYASKVVPARRTTTLPYNIVADYYWPEKK